MKSETQTETTAAAPAVGRELITSALQRNPVIAALSAVAGSIIGLFRRPAAPPAAGEGKSVRRPTQPSAPWGNRRDRTNIEGGSNGDRTSTEPPTGKRDGAKRFGTVLCSANVKIGGHSHG